MSRDGNVLYDAPGPKTRRWSVIGSVIAVLVIIWALYQFVYLTLKKNDQLSMQLWGPVIDPDHEVFSQVWARLGEGWLATFKAAGFAIIFSIAFGVGLALLRAQLSGLRGRRFTDRPPAASALLRWATVGGRGASRFWVEFFRGLPVVVTIFFVYKVLADYGLDFEDPMWFLVIGLTLYNGVVIGEILRSGMSGLPHGQHEAAASVGLSTSQSIRLVQLPQALRIMLPALISQIVVIFKDTSLGTIVAYSEALRVTKGIVEILYNPIPMYTITGVMYILVCYALSKLAQYTERRMSRSGMPEVQADTVTAKTDLGTATAA